MATSTCSTQCIRDRDRAGVFARTGQVQMLCGCIIGPGMGSKKIREAGLANRRQWPDYDSAVAFVVATLHAPGFAGATLVLGTRSAMFDPDAFPDRNVIRANRELAPNLHFGRGMHSCYGTPINMVQLPEIAQALLELNGQRRASGSAGRIVYDGPFPDRLIVAFDRSDSLRSLSR